MPQSHTETTVIAFTVGAANLALLQWLQDQRAKINRGGTASPNPWASPSQSTATVHTSPSSAVATSSVHSPSGQGSPSAASGSER